MSDVSETTVGLEARDLVKQFSRRRVVDGVSVKISRGEIVGLLGPNGAGKTTSFLLILGLIRPDAGRVMLEGDDITRLPMYLRARGAGSATSRRKPLYFEG